MGACIHCKCADEIDKNRETEKMGDLPASVDPGGPREKVFLGIGG